ncbi:MAG TPA: tetratricopeptide repeat protein [Streptosporangiaceae bacterium]
MSWPVRSGSIPPLTPGFVARPESAPGLGQVLTPGTAVALTPARASRTPVPPGSPDWRGCCGKTQLAVYYAESLWQARELELLLWVTAVSRGAILSGYAAGASAVLGVGETGDAEATAARFLGWLGESGRPWLIVLDDVASPADMEGLWPAGPAGRTLVTTSLPPAAFGPQQLAPFPMAGLSRREALSYLLGMLTDDRGQRTGAIDLVDMIGGEPLALGQAGAVVDNSGLSCRDYTDLFARKREQLAGSFPGRPPAAAISWTLCVEQACRILPGAPVQAMLVLGAVLDGHWIPAPVFTTAPALDYAAEAARRPASQDDAWACVASLQHAGLVTVDRSADPALVRIAPSVQAAVRSAAPRELLERAALAAASALLDVWPAADAGNPLAECLRSCAASVTRIAGDSLWTGDTYRLLFRAGQSLEDAGLTVLAAAHWNHVAAASERYLGADHPDSLAAGDRLAETFLAAGRALEALPWFRRVLADRTKALGTEHPATIEFEAKTGRALLAARRPDEAVSLLERIATDRAQLRGSGDPEALDARDALAAAYCAAGRTGDGIEIYRRTLADRERGQGARHAATLSTALRLADAYLASERIKEAISAYKRVLSGRERTFGRDHPDTITARSRLAIAYQDAGKMAIAVQMHEQASADSERILGVDHADSLSRQLNLAHAYYAVGRIGDATRLLRDTAERCERSLPPDDDLTRAVTESLARIVGSD